LVYLRSRHFSGAGLTPDLVCLSAAVPAAGEGKWDGAVQLLEEIQAMFAVDGYRMAEFYGLWSIEL
jgi:hypothetical protein